MHRFSVQNVLTKLVEIQRCPARIGSIRKQRKTGIIFKRESEGHVNADVRTFVAHVNIHVFKLHVRGLLSVATQGNAFNATTVAQFQKNIRCDCASLVHNNAKAWTLGNKTGIQFFLSVQSSNERIPNGL